MDRRHSEMDMNALRRVGEALLLAQNRARASTERADRCERLLRTLMAQWPTRHQMQLSFEMVAPDLSDWELLQSMTITQVAADDQEEEEQQEETQQRRRRRMRCRKRRHTADPDTAAMENVSIHVMAQWIVQALHATAKQTERRRTDVSKRPIQRMHVWWINPSWTLVAGVVLGFLVGVTLSRQSWLVMRAPAVAVSPPKPRRLWWSPSAVASYCWPFTRSFPFGGWRVRHELVLARLPISLSVEDITYSLHHGR